MAELGTTENDPFAREEEKRKAPIAASRLPTLVGAPAPVGVRDDPQLSEFRRRKAGLEGPGVGGVALEPKDAPEGWGPYAGRLAFELAQGAGAGFGDRLAALTTGDYEKNLAKIRAFDKETRRRYPVASAAANLAGSFALPVGGLSIGPRNLPRLSAALGGAATGGLYGGLVGAGGSEDLGNFSDVARRAGQGAALGGLGGAALGGVLGPAAAKGGQRGTPANLSGARPGVVAKAAEEAPPAFLENRIAKVPGSLEEGAKAAADRNYGAWRSLLNENFATASSPEATRAEAIGVESLGLAARKDAVSKVALEGYAKDVNALGDSERLALMNHIETVSENPAWPNNVPDKLQPLARDVRALMKSERASLENLPEEMRPAFVEDYLRHFWKDPEKARTALGLGGGGVRGASSGFTKKRTLPTYADGIKAGLEPLSTDPIAISLSSLSNSRAWRARKEFLQTGLSTGDVKWMRPGDIGPGMKALDGFPTGGPRMVPVAPTDWAIRYNNLFSKGLSNSNYGALFEGVRALNNGMKQAELGFSGFHLFTEGHEFIASNIGQSVGELLAGKPGMAAKSIKEAVVGPLREATPFSRGAKVIDQYLGKTDRGPTWRKIVDLGTRAGMIFKPSNRELLLSSVGGTGSGNLVRSLRRGSLGRETREGALDVAREWASKPVRQAVKTALGAGIGAAAGGAVAPVAGLQPDDPRAMTAGGAIGAGLGGGGSRAAARFMETLMSPVFEYYVPRVKSAAFFDKMGSWLKLNPTANEAEQLAAARKIRASMDNRFGLLNRDTLFWKNQVNDWAQMLFLSPTWQIGTIREIAGAAPEGLRALAGPRLLESGAKIRGLNTKGEYVTGLLTSAYGIGSLYEYFMTEGGKKPGVAATNPERDLPVFAQMHPRTGGVLPAEPPFRQKALPEEAQLPGYAKDILSMRESIRRAMQGDFGGLGSELTAKFSPMAKLGQTLLTGRNWRGDPIADPSSGLLGHMGAFVREIGQEFKPISIQTMEAARPGSAVSQAQRLTGIRPASKFLNDPQGHRAALRSVADREYDAKIRHDLKAAVRAGDAEEAVKQRRLLVEHGKEMRLRKSEGRR